MNLTKMSKTCKTCTMKGVRGENKKVKELSEHWQKSYGHRSRGLVWKWSSLQEQSTDSAQASSKVQCSHRFSATINTAHLADRTNVLCLGWCSSPITGSLDWLEKMPDSGSVSPITKSVHYGDLCRFQRVSTAFDFHIIPQSPPIPVISPSTCDIGAKEWEERSEGKPQSGCNIRGKINKNNVNYLKISSLFTETEQENLNFICKHKIPRIVKLSWSRKSKQEKREKTKSKTARGISTADFLLHYTVMAIKSAWQWPPNKHIDLWKKTKHLYISPQS